MLIKDPGCGGQFETGPCYVAQTSLKFGISHVSPFSADGIGTHYHI